MNKILFLFFLFYVGCGSHEQSLQRFRVEQKTTKVAGGGPIEAVEQGDWARLKKYIEEGLDIDAKTENGVTLLMLAVKNKQFPIIEYLVQAKADLEIKVEKGDESGKVAKDFVGGEDEVVQILSSLLSQGNLESSWLNKPMFEAIKRRNVFNLKWLLEKGADVNFQLTRKKLTPLIGLFTLIKGVKEDDAFEKVLNLFDSLVSFEGLDVNLGFGRKKPLKRCQSRARRDHAGYKSLCARLVDMGAH